MGPTLHPIYTIGHSSHAPESFLALLQRHNIEAVGDVRSAPYSRYAPQFNHDEIRNVLESQGIEYMFLGCELGGRPPDQACYDAEGRVQYELVAATDGFEDGIRSVMRIADDYRIALMCTEKEPLECHRTLLVAKVLWDRSVSVDHILADGRLESHHEAMIRLLGNFKLPPHGDMFRSTAEVITEAVNRQARKVAFKGEPQSARQADWEDPF